MEKLRQTTEADSSPRDQTGLQVVYRHFPLHPETPADGLTLEQLFAGRNIDVSAAQARMARLMAAEGLPYGDRTMTYNSRLAQELGKWADEQPGGEALHDALFRAYFVDNINLAKIDNLVGVVARAGLSQDSARSALVERRYRQAVDADWQRSRDLNVTGIPTFVVGNQSLVGARSFEELLAFVSG